MIEEMMDALWVMLVFSLAVVIDVVSGIVFLILKLCGTIEWSWWWVAAPFWGLALILLPLLFVAFVVNKDI